VIALLLLLLSLLRPEPAPAVFVDDPCVEGEAGCVGPTIPATLEEVVT
jgi:hypothetical protein